MCRIVAMLNTYIFVLGRKSELSRAELYAVFGDVMEVAVETKQVLIANFRQELGDVQVCLNRFGGTMKVCKVFGRVKTEDECNALIGDELVERAESHGGGKFLFGVSLYSFSKSHESVLRGLLKDSKKYLKSAGHSSRFLNKPWKSVSDVAVQKEGLINDGAEIVIAETREGFYLGRTVAIQDFENYGKRDYEKPKRNPKRGMLPPKLAQMMINISGVNLGCGFSEKKTSDFMSLDKYMSGSDSKGVVYDPFCGNGTVLMEAMLMGFDVIGSDISGDAVSDTERNLKWLQMTYPETNNRKWDLFVKDVGEVDKRDLKEKVDAVVTESYLGPPMNKFPNEDRRMQVDQELSGLLIRAFKSFDSFLATKTPIVITIPIYKEKKNFYPMKKSVEKITSLGYSSFALLDGERFLIYDRPDQIVGRQLWRFQKKHS